MTRRRRVAALADNLAAHRSLKFCLLCTTASQTRRKFPLAGLRPPSVVLVWVTPPHKPAGVTQQCPRLEQPGARPPGSEVTAADSDRGAGTGLDQVLGVVNQAEL